MRHGTAPSVAARRYHTSPRNERSSVIVNLEETPGKVVGKIKRRGPAETLAWLNRQVRALGIKLPFPKGVQWAEQQLCPTGECRR
jgi:hypothetical protein